MKKYLNVIYPTALALAIIAGIFIGLNLKQNTKQANPKRSYNLVHSDKISFLLNLIEQIGRAHV